MSEKKPVFFRKHIMTTRAQRSVAMWSEEKGVDARKATTKKRAKKSNEKIKPAVVVSHMCAAAMDF